MFARLPDQALDDVIAGNAGGADDAADPPSEPPAKRSRSDTARDTYRERKEAAERKLAGRESRLSDAFADCVVVSPLLGAAGSPYEELCDVIAGRYYKLGQMHGSPVFRQD